MSQTLKEKLLGLTAVRYHQMPIAMETFRDSDDPLGTLLRVHLLSEGIMEELIRISFNDNANALLSVGLTYKQKLELLAKINIEDDWPLLPDYIVGSLRKLNSLRNRLAHNLNADLSNQQVIDLFMNEEQVYGDMSEVEVGINLKRYAFFILGSMLPKHEEASADESV